MRTYGLGVSFLIAGLSGALMGCVAEPVEEPSEVASLEGPAQASSVEQRALDIDDPHGHFATTPGMPANGVKGEAAPDGDGSACCVGDDPHGYFGVRGDTTTNNAHAGKAAGGTTPGSDTDDPHGHFGTGDLPKDP